MSQTVQRKWTPYLFEAARIQMSIRSSLHITAAGDIAVNIEASVPHLKQVPTSHG